MAVAGAVLGVLVVIAVVGGVACPLNHPHDALCRSVQQGARATAA
jgi:hypothetical protein